jgi:hypothetical protein
MNKSEMKIDLITHDSKNDEYSLCLVENGPYETNNLKILQERIYNAVDIAIEGIFAQKYPESIGNKIKIQIDLYNNPTDEAYELIDKLNDYIKTNEEYKSHINNSKFIKGIRIVSNNTKKRSH